MCKVASDFHYFILSAIAQMAQPTEYWHYKEEISWESKKCD